VTYKLFRPSRNPQPPRHKPGYLAPGQAASQQFLISLSGIFLQAAESSSNRPQVSEPSATRGP